VRFADIGGRVGAGVCVGVAVGGTGVAVGALVAVAARVGGTSVAVGGGNVGGNVGTGVGVGVGVLHAVRTSRENTNTINSENQVRFIFPPR
jgi:hypothetical protein